ncbi:MAG: AAA family ATPase [Gemmataceae bacterium]|nr:AAA family ATPase [Gemmataceae bacterium]
MQRVAIVDPNESTRESLRTMLLGIDFIFLDAICSRYEYFFDVVADSIPDLVLVSLDADKERALQMIAQLAVQYPHLPMITISKDHGALLESLQRGARYFLTQPIVLENLLTALRRAGAERSDDTAGNYATGNRSSSAGGILAILGSRGGVGCTTLAVNIAATLAAEPGHNAALIDLDLVLGDADVVIELQTNDSISIADLSREFDRLDLSFLKRALAPYDNSNLSILRHPLDIIDYTAIHENHVERILNLLRINYSYLVVDLSKTLLPTDITALRLADVVLLVAQLELGSLRNVVRLFQYFGHEPALAEKTRVVINRFGADTIEEGISLKKAEEVIGKPIFWQIPYDPKAVLGARIVGQPLIRHAPKSNIQRSIHGLVQTLIGKPVIQETRNSRSFLSLFSRSSS